MMAWEKWFHNVNIVQKMYRNLKYLNEPIVPKSFQNDDNIALKNNFQSSIDTTIKHADLVETANTTIEDVINFGKRRALACTANRKIQILQQRLRSNIQKAFKSFNYASRLLLLLDHLWTSAEDIMKVVMRASKLKENIFFHDLVKQASYLVENINRLIDDVINSSNVNNFSSTTLAKHIRQIDDKCDTLRNILTLPSQVDSSEMYDNQQTTDKVHIVAAAVESLMELQTQIAKRFQAILVQKVNDKHSRAIVARPVQEPTIRKAPTAQANLWQRARFLKTESLHGQFSWVSHRLIIGPLLLEKDSKGNKIDDVGALVSSCLSQNCSLKLIVSVAKDYVLQ